ncbi:MAG TPA: serine hydrolase domain-containing protein [Thermoanaerobaculia bacterium]|nr:serine hydrolase domain-containing protein [Thermoanaerobaculia bacterium]
MRTLLRLALLVFAATSLLAQDALPPEMRASIDKAANEILAKTGAPSASIAVVKDGKIAYVHAYGNARLDPAVPATTQMRYSIGSISKQFTASALLMMQEEGKLSLDDKVVRWIPEATRAKDVTIREILSMTSGYQDFWPQDYVMPNMMNPATPDEVVNGWAKKPLDFEPGSKWQYSNTNYVIAGMIFERVSGMPLVDFLQQRVFGPLQMTSVFNTDVAALPATDAMRYLRYAAGPLRVAPKEGKGWMYAAGELAMTASDLAKWDISIIDQSILKPESYRELEHEVELSSGVGTHYALGVGVSLADNRRQLSHGGEVSGFTAQNTVYPDDRAAIVVLTNLDATGASGQITGRIAKLLFSTTDPGTQAALDESKKIFAGLQKGQIDRSLFTSNANAYFSDQALKDFATSLGPLGTPQDFTQASQSLRGGMVLRRYTVKFAKQTFNITTFWMPDGKLEQYIVAAAE